MSVAPRRLLPAVNDIIRAAEWYDDQPPGLGDEFVSEVNLVISALPQHAEAHRIRFADVRCVRLKKFKAYAVYYSIWEDTIVVLAIFHGKRHPRRLRERRQQIG
jgi:plasmid stabilization system protein ParE